MYLSGVQKSNFAFLNINEKKKVLINLFLNRKTENHFQAFIFGKMGGTAFHFTVTTITWIYFFVQNINAYYDLREFQLSAYKKIIFCNNPTRRCFYVQTWSWALNSCCELTILFTMFFRDKSQITKTIP